jgi:cytochrome bd-type quinol oxidase subunit 2
VDVIEFYGVIAGINFTLLGLWWVTVRERADLRDTAIRTGRTAYAVSLQFVVPGTAALLAQVAPEVPLLWRTAFTLAGIIGAVAILLLARALSRAAGPVRSLLMYLAVPLYCLVAVVAAVPNLNEVLALGLSALQIEAVLSCFLVLLAAQTSWAAAMTPLRASVPAERMP